jgi:hypothetical protein
VGAVHIERSPRDQFRSSVAFAPFEPHTPPAPLCQEVRHVVACGFRGAHWVGTHLVLRDENGNSGAEREVCVAAQEAVQRLDRSCKAE